MIRPNFQISKSLHLFKFCEMKVLITGATGLVGKQLTTDLLNNGHEVNYLTTSKSKIENSTNYKGYYWNPAQGEIDIECFKGVTAIVNLAGASIAKRWTAAYKKEVLNSRTDSLEILKKGLEEFGSKQIKSFVSASAIGIYPDSQSTFYEETNVEIDDSFLGEVVEAWEKAADQFSKFSFPVSKVRIGLVLSDEGGALPQMVQPIQNYIGAALGTGEQWQSWIHIEDLSRLFIFLLENELEGVFNGVAPNPVTNKKLTKTIAETLKQPLILPNVPKFVLKTMFGEMGYILLASQRVSSKKIENLGFEFVHANICNALASFYAKDEQIKSTESFSEQNYV